LAEEEARPKAGDKQPSVVMDPMAVAASVEPRFSSIRYGDPAYCQLARDCPIAISEGADERSEMGVFHDLYQPQRLNNLLARVDEYEPTATEVAVILVT
jgi:hypothetical protein